MTPSFAVGLAVAVLLLLPVVRVVTRSRGSREGTSIHPQSPDEIVIFDTVRSLTAEPILGILWKSTDTTLVTHDAMVSTGYARGPLHGWGHIFQLARTDTGGWTVIDTAKWVS